MAVALRKPAVAGGFYPASPETLRRTISAFMTEAQNRVPPELSLAPEDIVGGVVPHAGYIYSALTAAVFYNLLKGRRKPELVVIIGPNHHGYGYEISISPADKWLTPLGEVEVDKGAGEELVRLGASKGLDIGLSHEAHMFEHSVEVQLPFLQYLWDTLRVLPVVVKYQRKRDMVLLGDALGELLIGKDVLLIASSDMSHYVPHEWAVKTDTRTFPYLESMDWDGFYRVVLENEITACGVGAITAVMVASKNLGATTAKVLDYTTSAMASGDYSRVVGYMSAVFYRR